MDARVTIAGGMESQDGRDPRLARIADITGVPVHAFFSEADAAGAAGLQELIRLWDGIPDAAGRAELLACARVVAARSRDGAG